MHQIDRQTNKKTTQTDHASRPKKTTKAEANTHRSIRWAVVEARSFTITRMTDAALSGIFVPTLVPLRSDAVDESRLNNAAPLHEKELHEEEVSRHIAWLLDRGVAGVYPNGSTGEFLRLDDATQDRITELSVAACGDRGHVLGGAAGATVPIALKRCEAAARRGCRAAAVVAPFYYQLADDAVEAFYRELAARSSIDLLLYNIPIFASAISVDVVTRLALDCPRIIGIKDSSGDLAHMQRMLTAIRPQRPDFAFLTGWDNVLASMIGIGCDGGTHAAANVVPEVLVQIRESVLDGDWQTARYLQAPLATLFDAMIGCGTFPDGFRIGATARGFDFQNGLLPRSEAETSKRQELSSQMPGLLKPFEHVLHAD